MIVVHTYEGASFSLHNAFLTAAEYTECKAYVNQRILCGVFGNRTLVPKWNLTRLTGMALRGVVCVEEGDLGKQRTSPGSECACFGHEVARTIVSNHNFVGEFLLLPMH